MINRQFSDAKGQSHLEKLSQEQFESLCQWQSAGEFKFHVYAPGTFLDWHPADGKLIVVTLSGQLKITVTDGTSIICKPGDTRIVSDTGKGHTGQVVGDEPCVVLMLKTAKLK